MSWEQSGEDIDGRADYDNLGTSVSLSANGSTIVIGASSYMPDSTGFYVKVYRTHNDGRNWVQIGQTLSSNAVDDYFGHSVDITADGMTIVCGSPGDLALIDRPGYVRVFSLEGGDILGTDTWKQIGQDIIGEANGDQFGWSASVSDDGKILTVGARFSYCVRVYRMNDSKSGWVQLGDDIDDEYEMSVSLSGGGNKVAIGSESYDDNKNDSGRARVFDWESNWKQQGPAIAGDGVDDGFGRSVALSADASTLVIGASDYYSPMQDTMSKSILLTVMAETGCRSARPSPAMPLRIILDIL